MGYWGLGHEFLRLVLLLEKMALCLTMPSDIPARTKYSTNSHKLCDIDICASEVTTPKTIWYPVLWRSPVW